MMFLWLPFITDNHAACTLIKDIINTFALFEVKT